MLINDRQGGRAVALRLDRSEESPGIRGTGHRVTPGWENPRESAAENYRRAICLVRMKRRGKSSPRRWQHRRL